MIIIPAIDLKDGQCVRLRQGLMDDTTVFSDNPVDITHNHLIRKLTTQLRHKLRMRHCHCANNQITNPCFNTQKTDLHVVDLSKKFEQDGVSSIVYTDIARDGMMQGVNE
jgi:phosphoribosylformimino-5-aminoimidazole carboxamide ribonucleotide (ProFAR) isomerase